MTPLTNYSLRDRTPQRQRRRLFHSTFALEDKAEGMAAFNIAGVDRAVRTYRALNKGYPDRLDSLVVATGGLSIPKIGATPFGYHIAEQFGLSPVQKGIMVSVPVIGLCLLWQGRALRSEQTSSEEALRTARFGAQEGSWLGRLKASLSARLGTNSCAT